MDSVKQQVGTWQTKRTGRASGSRQPSRAVQGTPAINPYVSPAVAKRLYLLEDAALKNGVHIVGGPGSGKSRLMGRLLAWQAFVRCLPVVVLDPTGGVVANIVDKLMRLPKPVCRRLLSRILYVDAGAGDFLVPTPLYYRLQPSDSLMEIANRFPAVLKRQDPHLQSAPILGWNSLQECAIHSGRIAAALGRQVDFVADLISHPRAYKEELRRALADFPELEPAVSYFRELMDPNNAALRERRTGSFANKLLPFVSDPTMLAGFAASERGVDWQKVVKEGQMVLVDFQSELDPERRQFKLLWWYRDFSAFVRARGMAGRGQEILFLIDEVTQLVGQRAGEGRSILAEDLEETVAVHGRNFGANVVIAHQNLSQVDEGIRNILMQCGTQIIGRIANPDDALFLARQFLHYNPQMVKKTEPVWMNVMPLGENGVPVGMAQPEVIDHREVEYSPEEQLLLATEQFRLPRFHFLLRPATAEGTVADRLYRLSIEKLDAGQYPDNAQVQQALAHLRKKCGLPLEQLLAEIQGRRADRDGEKRKQVKETAAAAILDAEPAQDDETTENKPEQAAPQAGGAVAGQPAAPSQEERHDDDFWR